jgi:hypothetical protein
MPQPEFLPDEVGDDDRLLEQYRNPQMRPEVLTVFSPGGQPRGDCPYWESA